MVAPLVVNATLVPKGPFRVVLRKGLSSREIELDQSLHQRVSDCARGIFDNLRGQGWTELQANLSTLVVTGKDKQGKVRAISIQKGGMKEIEVLREDVLAQSKLSKEMVKAVRSGFFSQDKGWVAVSCARLPHLNLSLTSREKKAKEKINKEIQTLIQRLEEQKQEIENHNNTEVDPKKKRELTHKKQMIVGLIEALKKADRGAIVCALQQNIPPKDKTPDALSEAVYAKLKLKRWWSSAKEEDLRRIAEEQVVFLTLSSDEKRERRDLLKVREDLSVSIREPSIEELVVSWLKADAPESVCFEHCPSRFQPILKEYWTETFFSPEWQEKRDREEIGNIFLEAYPKILDALVCQEKLPKLEISEDVYNKIEPKEMRDALLGSSWCTGLEYTDCLKKWGAGKSGEEIALHGLKILSGILEHSSEDTQNNFYDALARAMIPDLIENLSEEVSARWGSAAPERSQQLFELAKNMGREILSAYSKSGKI